MRYSREDKPLPPPKPIKFHGSKNLPPVPDQHAQPTYPNHEPIDPPSGSHSYGQSHFQVEGARKMPTPPSIRTKPQFLSNHMPQYRNNPLPGMSSLHLEGRQTISSGRVSIPLVNYHIPQAVARHPELAHDRIVSTREAADTYTNFSEYRAHKQLHDLEARDVYSRNLNRQPDRNGSPPANYTFTQSSALRTRYTNRDDLTQQRVSLPIMTFQHQE